MNQIDLTENQIVELLRYAHYNPDDYEDWINVGMILKDTLGGSGFDVWDSWSSQSLKYDPANMETKWKSFKGSSSTGNKLTIGSLIEKAQRNGFLLTDLEDIKKDRFLETKRSTRNIKIDSSINNSMDLEKNNRSELLNNRISQALQEEAGTFSELFHHSQERLFNSIVGLNYNYDRDITVKTLRHYGDGWVENFGPFNITGPLLAGTPEGYAIRNINYEKRLQEIEQLPLEEQKEAKKTNPKYYKPSTSKSKALDIPQGLEFVIQQPDIRDPKTGYKIPIFIFEGYYDVRSLYEATGIDGISLNGIGNIQVIIDQLKKFKVDRPIVLALDNDSTGVTKNKKRYDDLKEAGFTVYWNQNFYGKYKDANELLINDRNQLIQSVEESKKYFYQEFEKSLNKNQCQHFKKHVRQSLNQPEYPTGFQTLDSKEFLNGGLHPGLYGIGAVSSLGKTSLVLQMADNLAEAGIPVLYFSLEMSKYELMAKSISRYTYQKSYDPKLKKALKPFEMLQILDAKQQQNFSMDDINFIEECTDLYFERTGDNLRIIEGIGEITVEDIREEIEKQVTITGKKPVLIIDYLQLISQPNKIKHLMTDKQIIDHNIFQLKHISRDFNIPVIFISSYNRSSYDKEGNFQSFLGSNGIEFSADVLLSLERNISLTQKQKDNERREDYFYKQNIKKAVGKERETDQKWLKLVILKNRNGKSRGEVGLCFNSKYNNFLDYGEIYPETGTRESLEEQTKRYNAILQGRTTINESPDPVETFKIV